MLSSVTEKIVSQDTNGMTIGKSYIWPVPLPDNELECIHIADKVHNTHEQSTEELMYALGTGNT